MLFLRRRMHLRTSMWYTKVKNRNWSGRKQL